MKMDQVAVDPRSLLAAERTMLAWLRTGISLITFGFVIARIGVWLEVQGRGADEVPGAGWMGALFGLVGTAANVLGITRYLAFRTALLAGHHTPVARVAVVTFAVSAAVLGALVGAVIFLRLL
jgi:putative membrane protein